MKEELNRPLGQKLPKPARALPSALALAFLGIAGVAGLAFVVTRPAPQPPAAVAEQVREPEPDAGVKPQEAPENPAETAEQSQTPAELDAAPLVEAVPEGSITEKIPVPEPRRQEQGLAHLPDPELSERGASGILPKRSSAGLRPMDVYSRQPATEGNFGVARVVLIVGGIGISQTGSQQAIRQLPGSVTLAFAPYGNSLLRWMQEARRSGHELLLQVPMEPFGDASSYPGPHTLKTGADPMGNIADLHWSMSRITNYVGIINFLGGKFITDPAAMKPVFDEIATRGLLFVDDGSIRNSQTGEAAKASLLPHARVGVQIDSIRTREEIGKQLALLAEEAKRSGVSIGIANAFPESIDMIAKFVKEASAKGIEITPVSAIVLDPERKR